MGNPEDIDGPFNLALGTWFYKLLVDAEPGGLPADFFTYGASALLYADSIVCDRDAFESEMAFASTKAGSPHWLSSVLYRQLHDDGVLQLKSYKELMKPTLDRLKSSGFDGVVNDITERHLTVINQDEGSAVPWLDPLLEDINTVLGDHLFRSEKYIPYRWQSQERLNRSESLWLTEDVELELSSLVVALPHRRVLMSPLAVKAIDPGAHQGFLDNLQAERGALARWMNNDPAMPREAYQEQRLGDRFRPADRAFDKVREREAHETFDLLMRLRSDTKKERRALQDLLRFAQKNGRTSDSIRSDLREAEAFYQALFQQHSSGVASKWVSAVGAVFGIAAQASNNLAIRLSGLAAMGADIFLEVDDQVHRTRSRRSAPVGYLMNEVRRLGD